VRCDIERVERVPLPGLGVARYLMKSQKPYTSCKTDLGLYIVKHGVESTTLQPRDKTGEQNNCARLKIWHNLRLGKPKRWNKDTIIGRRIERSDASFILSLRICRFVSGRRFRRGLQLVLRVLTFFSLAPYT
jgi:hypothetical protein